MDNEVSVLIEPEQETIGEIGVGLNEMVLKFQGDLYKGRFFYVNTSEDGEKIGSGDPDVYDTTTYIENAEISPVHCTIVFNRDLSEYFLFNSAKSHSGTWVKILPYHLQLTQVIPGSTFKLAETAFQVSVPNYFNLSSNFQILLDPDFKQIFPDLQDFLSNSGSSLSQSQKSRLFSSQSLIQSLPDPFPVFHLLTDQETIQLTPRGLTLANGQSSVRIVYTQSGYKFDLHSELPLYYKLTTADEYRLQSGEAFKIGKLEFLACRFHVGRWSHQGKRQSMEDTDVVIHNLYIFEDLPASFFAVYDGHGGAQCSEYLKQELHHKIRSKVLESTSRLSDVFGTLKSCILSAFKEIDQSFSMCFPGVCKVSGSAAIFCIVLGDRILTVNLGDSRAVLSRKGRAIELSVDHKPSSPAEYERILASGGNVTLGRIDSKLSVSRAFGDFNYKGGPQGNLVEICPDITQVYLNPSEDEFLVIGCDGLFEAYTSQELVNVIRKRLAEMPAGEQNPNRVIREIINEAVFEGKTNDNVTALLVNLSSNISLD